MKTKSIKTKPSHYELLQRACDKALSTFERAKTNEQTAKHYFKTADKDNSKTDLKILKLEYQRAKYRKKARKVAFEIASLRLRQWLKLHEDDMKLYQLNEAANSDESQDTETSVDSETNETTSKQTDTPSVLKQNSSSKKSKKASTQRKTDTQSLDLLIIEGIGPKVLDYLKNAGISTFEQLAVSDTDYLKSILKANRNYISNPSTWAAQAQLVLDGKIEELKTWQVELKSGKLVK